MAQSGWCPLFIVLALLLTLLAGLASLALVLAGFYVLWAWFAGELIATAWLVGAGLALAWSLLGRHVVMTFYRRGMDDPQHHGAGERVAGVRGSALHVETEGAPGAPTLLLTHGWGFDASAWYYIRKHLGRRFRLILWDLPGLGASSSFEDGVFEIERFAENLRLLVERSGGPLTLVGHSIGGMTMLTLCRRYPDLLGSRVERLVLVDTTFTAPHRTTIAAGVLPAFQKPVAKAILQLNRLLWPLVWLMNWQSYLNGTSHLVTRLTSFSSDVTRGQLDFAARFTATQHPAVVAKGMLATLDWDETGTLAQVTVPATIIVGNEDRLTIPLASRHMSQKMPNARLAQITPAGHSGIVEEGDAYASAIAIAAVREPGERTGLHVV